MIGGDYPLDLTVALADHHREDQAHMIADDLVEREMSITCFIGLSGGCETAPYWEH